MKASAFEKKTPNDVKKGLLVLLMSSFLLVPSALNLIRSFDFSRKAILEEAQIIDYVPEVRGRAGGRREVTDYYKISFSGIEKKVKLGSRMVSSKEKVKTPKKEALFKRGDRIPVAYLPENPGKNVVLPGENLLFTVYHSHNSIALMYLFKFASLLLFILAFRFFYKSLSQK